MAIGANCVSPRDVESILTRLNTVNHWSKFPGVLNYKVPIYKIIKNEMFLKSFFASKRLLRGSEKGGTVF